MTFPMHRTKIVATIGPASSSEEVLRQMMLAGMSVARLNFSHGSYDDHAERVRMLRSLAAELDLPLALLQDLQGPKVRVGQLPDEGALLQDGEGLALVPMADFTGQAHTVGIDYPFLAEEAAPGTQVLLDDGLMELRVEEVRGGAVWCRVVEGGRLKSRKGVNFPSLSLRLPSLTEKDQRDVEFGISQGVDFVSLSFVRRADDVRALKGLLRQRGADIAVVAKIEKPQAVAELDAIVSECDAVMVARGDLGVEMSPEKVPLIQKRIIRLCNQKKIPIITATQMLESMMRNPRPTRAEASDVANAIIDGTDAVMLSGESAVGDYPVEAVRMLARVAAEVEPDIRFPNLLPDQGSDAQAICEAVNAMARMLPLRLIVAFTATGYTARLVAGERPSAPVVALTESPSVYRRLSLVWGVKPIWLERPIPSSETLLREVDAGLLRRGLAAVGDKILVVGGLPMGRSGGTNFVKIHVIGTST
jgi:pyruvate kinase